MRLYARKMISNILTLLCDIFQSHIKRRDIWNVTRNERNTEHRELYTLTEINIIVDISCHTMLLN